MTSVRSSFLCLPLTSDEIKNVVRLSLCRNSKSTTNPIQFEVFAMLAEAHPTGTAAEKLQETPLSPSFSRTRWRIFFLPSHSTEPSWVSKSPSRKRSTILPEPWKTLSQEREDRSVSYLTKLDSGAMINSLLLENYRTSRTEKSNFDYFRILLLNKRISNGYKSSLVKLHEQLTEKWYDITLWYVICDILVY